MFNIDNNGVISVSRGDSFNSPIFINKGTELWAIRYIIKEKDEVWFALKEPNQPFECAILKKKYTKENTNKYGDIVVSIIPEDTVNLLPGKYFYQIKLRMYDEETDTYQVNTIIDDTPFFII